MISRAFLVVLLTSFSQAYLLSEEECLNYTVYPVQYDVTITPYIYQSERFSYDGNVVITIIANAPNVNIIELDAKDLDIRSDSVHVYDLSKGFDYDIVNSPRPYEYDKVSGKLFIYLREHLKQYSVYNTQYQIRLSFSKIMKTDSRGVFVVKYEDAVPKYLIVTRLSPENAKFFIPCFDNPQFEAIFKFKVNKIVNAPGIQACNTSIIISEEQRRQQQKDYEIIEYLPSPQVAFHQLGFHHSSFERRTAKSRYNDSLIIWAQPGTLNYYKAMAEFGKGIINIIYLYSNSNRSIVNGPINVVAVPASTHNLDSYETGSWKLLTIGVRKIAYIPQYTSIEQVERMTFDLAQQLTRIWLGNPGENKRTRWKEEWFKEGVATYLAYFFLAQYNTDKHQVKYIWPTSIYGPEMKNKAMAADLHNNPSLASFDRTLAAYIPEMHKELVTMKTASLLLMVENWLGSGEFHLALVKYINSRRGKYISLEDFSAQLDLDTVKCQHEFFNGYTASKILNSWYQRSGYPVVEVKVLRDRTPNAIQLKQKKFSFINEARKETDYLIPISYFVQNNKNCFNCFRPRFTIGSQAYTFEENLNGGWIILNLNASGYYRVNYDVENWKMIAQTLEDNHLSIGELNRAQIVNDVFALYTANDLDYKLARAVLNYLDRERSQVVWDSVDAGFDMLRIEGAKCSMTKYLYEDWKMFMRQKVNKIYAWLYSNIEQQPRVRLYRASVTRLAARATGGDTLEPCRGPYEIEPDARQACYYTFLRDNRRFAEPSNTFAQEDKITAQRKVQQEKRFLFVIPEGHPKPVELVQSTIPPGHMELQTTAAPIKQESGGASMTISSIFSYVISVIIVVIFR